MGNAEKVIKDKNGKYSAVVILSEHVSLEEAVESMLEAMITESEEKIKKLMNYRKKGIKAVRFEDNIKDMSPEELESF
jgi:arsenate reductase-like glutaredoxin family protein